MRKKLARVRGLGFVLWHARHEFYHVLLGLIWAWVLRERWQEFNTGWILLSVFGSLLPDVEHVLYFLGYGKDEAYSREVFRLLKERKWRELTVFIEKGHKHQTDLVYHNFYIVIVLLAFGIFASLYEWHVGVILSGAMVIHYIFDIIDDFLMLGGLNPNWRRWGRGK